MNTPDNFRPTRSRGSRIWIGLILFIAGFALLAQKMGAPLPTWLFSWPMILIIIGISMGIKDQFRNPGSWILLLLGFLFLADNNMEGLNLRRYIGPIILIAIGLIFILRPRGNHIKIGRVDLRRSGDSNNPSTESIYNAGDTDFADAEIININAVFSGVKKYVVSKNFSGGSIVTFMGGAEINLLQADIKQPVELEINNVFGGTKIILPPNWDLKNEVTALFGGIEDKRNFNALNPEPKKILVIRGACIFGGIEVTSY